MSAGVGGLGPRKVRDRGKRSEAVTGGLDRALCTVVARLWASVGWDSGRMRKVSRCVWVWGVRGVGGRWMDGRVSGFKMGRGERVCVWKGGDGRSRWAEVKRLGTERTWKSGGVGVGVCGWGSIKDVCGVCGWVTVYMRRVLGTWVGSRAKASGARFRYFADCRGVMERVPCAVADCCSEGRRCPGRGRGEGQRLISFCHSGSGQSPVACPASPVFLPSDPRASVRKAQEPPVSGWDIATTTTTARARSVAGPENTWKGLTSSKLKVDEAACPSSLESPAGM